MKTERTIKFCWSSRSHSCMNWFPISQSALPHPKKVFLSKIKVEKKCISSKTETLLLISLTIMAKSTSLINFWWKGTTLERSHASLIVVGLVQWFLGTTPPLVDSNSPASHNYARTFPCSRAIWWRIRISTRTMWSTLRRTWFVKSTGSKGSESHWSASLSFTPRSRYSSQTMLSSKTAQSPLRLWWSSLVKPKLLQSLMDTNSSWTTWTLALS